MSLCNMLCLLYVCKHNLACSSGVLLGRPNVISLVSWFKLGRFLHQNFFHVNQHLKIKKLYSGFSQRKLATRPVDSFQKSVKKLLLFIPIRRCETYQILRDISNFERHLGASSKAESKLTTSPFTEFVIVCIFPQEQFNVQTTHLACD